MGVVLVATPFFALIPKFLKASSTSVAMGAMVVVWSFCRGLVSEVWLVSNDEDKKEEEEVKSNCNLYLPAPS